MSDSNPSAPKPESQGDTEPKAQNTPDTDEVKIAVEIWKQIISVQMHFNDIEMRIRSMYVTVLLGTVAATGWVVDKHLGIHVFSVKMNYAIAVLLAGIASAHLFYFMDRHWYHQLLRGAVDQGRKLDEYYATAIPALGLTSKISGASPLLSFRKTWIGRLLVLLRIISKPRVDEGQFDLHSTGKIELFYKSSIRLLWMLTFVSTLLGGVTVSNRSLVAICIDWAKHCLCSP